MEKSPILVRFEVEHMKYAIQQALTTHATDINEQIQKAVEAYCTPENLSRVLDEHVKQVLERTVKRSVEDFFVYGYGRQAVSETVEEKLSEIFKREEQA